MSRASRNRVEVLRGQLRHARSARPGLYGDFPCPSSSRDQALGARARARGALLPDQPRGRVRRAPAPAARAGRRGVLNAGAWTHYSWAIRDALEATGLPAVEVHISDVMTREEWRQLSVFDGLVVGRVSGKGADGYREALELAGTSASLDGERADRGGRAAARLDRCRRRELDRLLVPNLVNVRYLTGFTGTSGACVWSGPTTACSSPTSATPSAPEGGGRGLGGRSGGRAATGSPQLAKRAERQVGFEDDDQRAPAAKLEAAGRRGRRAGPRRGLVEELRRVKDAEELEAIAAARAGRRCLRLGRGRAGLAGRTERRWRGAARRGSASWAPSPPSRRSSPPARTARSRTPSRASARSATASWSSSTWAPSSTATARTAPGPSPPALGDEAREVYELVRARSDGARGGPAGRRDATSTRSPASRSRRRPRGALRPRPRPRRRASRSTRARASRSSEDTLRSGDVVTVEPGVYLPGRFGVGSRTWS